MKDVWLIRHAESIANIGEPTSTPREIPLSENGLRQADELASMIDARPDLVVVSPFVRTRQTAEPLLELYPDLTFETVNVQEFTYLSVSRCRGTDHKHRKPWVEEYWNRADPHYCDGDQSESFAEFIARCERFEVYMWEREYERAFVFTHEQFIKGLLWTSMGLASGMTSDSMKAFQNFMISFSLPNASVLRMKVDQDRRVYFGKIDTLVGASPSLFCTTFVER